jgi:hypothetical protein
MKTEEEKKLDDIFSKGLQHPNDHSPYMEDDWNAMEAMLDKHKKRPAIIYWLPVLAGVAALLLVVVGWWLLRPAAPQHVQQVASQVKKHSNSVDTSERIAKRTDTSGRLIAKQNSGKGETKPANERSSTAQPLFAAKPNRQKQASINYYTAVAPQVAKQTTNNKPVVTNHAVKSPDTVMLAQNGNKPNTANINGAIVNTVVDIPRANNVAANTAPNTVAANTAPKTGTDEATSNKIKPKRAVMAYRPQYALSVLGSSDINGVGSFQGGAQGKGNTVGLLFSAGVSKRFTISTGAVYSSKPYLTGFDNYHSAFQFATDPLSVKADCRVLDIPLNVDYSLFGNYKNKLSVGTGLSSYIMLHENYQFNYADPYYAGPSSYTVPHTNKYFLGVLNLQATYQRQLNSKFSLSAQPFLKLPLTNIGAGQAKLQTTGLALGVTWNLNSTSNP